MKNFEYKDMDEDNLELDTNNVRFFHIEGYTPQESLLMIEKDSIQKLVNSMIKIGFDGVFPLHIGADNIVGDGNSRLLAYRIAIGNSEYKELAIKHEIKGFGELKKTTKLPVLQYLRSADLSKYIRATHLVDEKKGWSTATKYAYFYKMYKDGDDYDFPDNIMDIVMNVSLYNFALQISKGNIDLKTNLEKAYHRRMSMFSRMLKNTELMNNEGDTTNVFKLIELKIDENNDISFTDKVSLDEFKSIILEFSKYISEKSIGQKTIYLDIFKKTFVILKQNMKVKSTSPTKHDVKIIESKKITKNISEKQRDILGGLKDGEIEISKPKVDKKMFFLEENIIKSHDDLKEIKKTLAKGWRERVLIENIMWYLVAKALKKILKHKTWNFIAEGDYEKITNTEQREIFKNLISLQETIKPIGLSTLVNKFNINFKKDQLVDGKPLFKNEEQAFINWITKEHNLYVSNLNEAAHGRWSNYKEDSLSESFDKLLTNLMKVFKSEW